MTVVNAAHPDEPQRRRVDERFLEYEVRLDEEGVVTVLLDFSRQIVWIDKFVGLGPRPQRQVRRPPQAIRSRRGQLHQAEHPGPTGGRTLHLAHKAGTIGGGPILAKGAL